MGSYTPDDQNSTDESLTAADFPGPCPDCGRLLGSVQAYSSHTCDAIIDAGDGAEVIDDEEILVTDGGTTGFNQKSSCYSER